MRVNIIGGGITGCVAALECANYGLEVHLYESSNHLGGVLRDIVVGDEVYLNGCQYINSGSPWFESLKGLLSTGFKRFPHTYGSVTELFGVKSIHQDFAQPVIEDLPVLTPKKEFRQNLESRIGSYGHYGEPLLSWLRGWGEISGLHADTVFGMQVPRVFFSKNIEATRAFKAASAEAEELLGLPRSILAPDDDIALAYLPESGFNQMFDSLHKVLERRGVSLHMSSPVTPTGAEERSVTLRSRKSELEKGWTIWCANPTPLLIASGCGKLDSPSSRCYCLTANLEISSELLPRYFQVFSSRTSIVRIFIYTLNGSPKISIEGFAGSSSVRCEVGQIAQDATLYLRDFGIDLTLSKCHLSLQRRYVNFTEGDVAKIESFNQSSLSNGFLPGVWHQYGRDSKIESIEKSIRSLVATQFKDTELGR